MGGLTSQDRSVAHVLQRAAAQDPDAPFLVFEDGDGSVATRTYSEAFRRAERAAGALAARGVGRGRRVHLHLANRPEFYDVWFGAAWLGAAIVPTNPLLTADELSFVVGHVGATLGVTSPELESVARSAGDLDYLVTGTDLEEAFERAPAVGEPSARSEDIAAVMYTSGTTSRPKGVLVTHANYLHVGGVMARHAGYTSDDVSLIVLPLFHANAQYYSTLPALLSGATVALMSRFSASSWGRQAAEHRATVASLFAAPIRMILAHPPGERDRDNRLRVVFFSQNVTEEQIDGFEERFGCPLAQLYGMTETIAPPLINPVGERRRNMTIGRPLARDRIRVIDEVGGEVAPGSVGELLVQGEPGRTLMAGHLDDPEATAAALRDGWLHTGDNVREDADGYFHFVDRTKDMIKRAGENVSAGEIEAVANRHPAVFESAAVGVPDELRDEAIKLFVVPAEGRTVSDRELIEWCSERLARFKVPSEIAFVTALPRTSVGKIQKHLLREEVD